MRKKYPGASCIVKSDKREITQNYIFTVNRLPELQFIFVPRFLFSAPFCCLIHPERGGFISFHYTSSQLDCRLYEKIVDFALFFSALPWQFMRGTKIDGVLCGLRNAALSAYGVPDLLNSGFVPPDISSVKKDILNTHSVFEKAVLLFIFRIYFFKA